MPKYALAACGKNGERRASTSSSETPTCGSRRVALDEVLAAPAGAWLRMVILDACRNNGSPQTGVGGLSPELWALRPGLDGGGPAVHTFARGPG